ncbi:HU family DNA-binding protein [Hoylesella pleuritidis]|uniref:HU family DNA-binding protein n=1 Tax=Hoylesella pleuritidis TaxID=407975 RepID=UPI0028D63EBD|nr:HU family DNA-binding protein [Hoylesella pleuritidis]
MLNYIVSKVLMKIGPKKGKTMYFAKADKPRIITFEEVIKDIAEMSSLTTGDVRNAIDQLAYYLHRELAEGNTVQLGQIGTFSVQAAGKQMEKEEDVTAATIKTPKIRFYLNAYLHESMKRPPLFGEQPQGETAQGRWNNTHTQAVNRFP